jgi:hypothetical protein
MAQKGGVAASAAAGSPKGQRVKVDLVPPPMAVADLQSQLAAQFDGEVFCRALVEDIVTCTEPDVVSAYMDEVAVPWAVQSVLTDVVEALALAFMEREIAPVGLQFSRHGGDVDYDEGPELDAEDATSVNELDEIVAVTQPDRIVISGPHGSRRQSIATGTATPAPASPDVEDEEEPIAVLRWSEAGWEPAGVAEPGLVPADSWCRASMQQRRRLIDRRPSGAPAAADTAAPAEGADRLKPSAHGVLRRGGSRSAAGSAGSRKESSADLGNTTRSSVSGTPTPSPEDLAAESAKKPRSAAGGKKVSVNAKASVGHDNAGVPAGSPGASSLGRSTGGEEGGEEEERLLRSVEASMSRMRKLKEMSENVHKQLLALKSGKDAPSFVVDGATHKVVEVLAVDPRALPQRTEPRVTVPGERDAQLDDAAPASRGGGSRLGARTPADRAKARRKDETGAAFWQAEPNTNPMVRDVVPAAGVTHRDGDNVTHTDLKQPKTRVTRQEYAKMVSLQATTAQAQAALEEALAGVGTSTTHAAAVVQHETDQAPSKVDGSADKKSSGAAPTGAAVAEKNAAAHKAPPPSAANTRVATPLHIKRPSSENSGLATAASSGGAGVRRTPTGGVAPHQRTVARVSTPAANATRPILRTIPRPTSGGAVAPGPGKVRPGSSAGHAAAMPVLRVNDTDDDVARDFLASLAPDRHE